MSPTDGHTFNGRSSRSGQGYYGAGIDIGIDIHIDIDVIDIDIDI